MNQAAYKQCPQCGTPSQWMASTCSHCGHRFVTNFGNPLNQTQLLMCGPTPAHLKDANSKKVSAGICGIVLGGFGIHKFLLGYNNAGIIMLLVTVLSCGLLSIITGAIGLIEGILYLTKSDEEFFYTYIANRKEWF